MASNLPLPTRQALGKAFTDPSTLLMVEQLFQQLASFIPADITGLQNLQFVLTAADTTNAPHGHVITPGANIGVSVAAGLVTITATPSGTNGQIQYNNAGVFGAFTTSGDATINTATGVLTLASVATAGTYGDSLTIPVLTLDAKGRTLSVTPTAIPLFTSTVKGLAPLSGGGTTNFLRADGTWAVPAGSGGTVSSVGLSLPATFTVSGSPVTGSGTLTAVYATQTANTIFAGPSTGAAAAPTFRALVTADLGTNTVANTTFRQSGALAVVGRSANSTGNVADLQATAASNQILREKSSALQFDTLSSLMDDVFGNAQGNVLYRGASTWAALAPGTSGQVLQTAGASANPSWVNASSVGGMTLLASATIVGSTTPTVTFAGISQLFKHLKIVVVGRTLATDNAFNTLGIQFNADTTAGHYPSTQFWVSTGTGSIAYNANYGQFFATFASSNTSNTLFSNVEGTIYNYSQSSNTITWSTTNSGISYSRAGQFGTGYWTPSSPAAVTSFKLLAGDNSGNAANFAAGTIFYLYGM